MFDPHIPYNDLPLLPWSFDYDQTKLLKLSIKANQALARLDGLSLLLPNYQLLISPLLAKESIASNAIENINTTMVDFLQQEALTKDTLSWAEKEVQHYRSTILYGIELIKKYGGISTNMLIELQSHIEPSKTGVRKIPGTIIGNSRTWETIYTPPEWEETIRTLLSNLESFVNTADDIDPLIKMAVIHHQFESIHPFYDGNGRVGRILMVLYLILVGKIQKPILFLSSYIMNEKSSYYDAFARWERENNYSPMIEFLLEWVIVQSQQTEEKIIAINDLIEQYITHMRDLGFKDAYMLATVFFKYPFVSVGKLSQELNVSRQSVYTYVKKLQTKWYIEHVKLWNHKLLYIPSFIELIQQ